MEKYIDVTGETSSNKEAYKKLADKGVGTIVEMHVGKEMKEEVAKNNMNLVLDKVEAKIKLKIIECSGFNRIKRN